MLAAITVALAPRKKYPGLNGKWALYRGSWSTRLCTGLFYLNKFWPQSFRGRPTSPLYSPPLPCTTPSNKRQRSRLTHKRANKTLEPPNISQQKFGPNRNGSVNVSLYPLSSSLCRPPPMMLLLMIYRTTRRFSGATSSPGWGGCSRAGSGKNSPGNGRTPIGTTG